MSITRLKGGEARSEALVQEGFQAQRSGDLDQAEALYRQALLAHAEQPAALQLLGLLARGRGDTALAEELMRRSLQADPRQPHVWNNLGNLLEKLARLPEAQTCFDRALAIEARYPDVHYNRARLLRTRGRLPEALQAVQLALTHAPAPTAPMLQLLAEIEADQGQIETALATLARALLLAPERPALLHNRAVLLQRRHRHVEALDHHQRALALGLDAADAHYNRGNTLQSLGHHEPAAAAYRKALARQPEHGLALYDLARLRWRLGDADFDAELRQASAAQPASAVGPGLRAHLLLRAERFDEAAAAFGQALEREPQAAGFLDGLARSLARQGQLEASLAAHGKAVAMVPRDASLRTSHATTLLQARRPIEAAAEAQLACEWAPDDQLARAVLGLAWRVLGDTREAWLNDTGRFVATMDLEPPPGFADMQTFNTALAQELNELHRDQAPPIDQTLRCGTQTLGDIFEQGHPLVDALKPRISAAINHYIANLPQDPTHPFLRRRSANWRYTDSWSSRLGHGGFHTNHVHPHGWISSAYYVAVPDSMHGSAACPGWLQFGQSDFDAGLADAVQLRVQPQPGRLVLFPSMFWHGTTPFDGPAQRLSIAFDVMPD